MKTVTLLCTALLATNLSFSQTDPIIKMVSPTTIFGMAPAGYTVQIDIGADGTIEKSVTIEESGTFKHTFNPALTVGTDVETWFTYKSQNILGKETLNQTNKIKYKVKDEATIISDMIIESEKENSIVRAVNKIDAGNFELRNTTLTYKATITNTYFQIPVARFNLVTNEDNKRGDVSLFTSVGAGVGLSIGRMVITRDNTGQVTNEEFSNTLGFHLGVLFASGTGEESRNVFAPTFNISLLDFQIGVGHELGTITPNQKRTFFTLSYAIPLYKLVKKSYRVWLIADHPYDSRKGSQQ